MPRKYCAVDAEGDAGRAGLLGLAVYSDDRQLWTTDRTEMVDQLLWHAKRGFTFVAHNAEYDLSVIWWQLGLTCTCITYNRVFNHGEWKYQAGQTSAALWDSLNLAGGLTVEELGQTLGCPKYPTPQRLLGLDPDRYRWRCELHGQGECLECYAVRDAEIVWRYMQSLSAVVSTWGATVQRRIGSTGLAVWRSLDHPEPIRLRDRKIAYLGRRAYYGGRVECLKLGHFAPIYAADVSSMYPSVMLSTPFPDPAAMLSMDALPPDKLPLEHEGAADVTVWVPHSSLPPLPNAIRDQRVFASGLQRGCWTLLELRYAVSQGCQVRRVHRVAWSTRNLNPFTYFVSVLWELRQQYQQAHDPREQAVKALLNETYGRFALAPELLESRIRPLRPAERSRDHIGCTHFAAYGMYMCATARRPAWERTWTNELWAAQITAAARIKLHQLLLLQGQDAVYCDTDSIFSRAPIQGQGQGLGQLGQETTYQAGVIVGPKMYSLTLPGGGVEHTVKGIPPELAGAFLAGRAVLIDRPISPHQMIEGKGQAGAWHTITRERRLTAYRRRPLSPEALELPGGWSETVPPVFGPSL